MTVERSHVSASPSPQAGGRTKADLAVPYALATVGGTLPVFLSPEQLWWVPVMAMVVYLAFGLNAARKQGLTLEFSDSFYYLGFTLTIASLLASLKPFEGGADVQPKEVLKLFGLGLFTTLIGVVGRTVLQMFYRTPSENMEAINQQIEVVGAEYLSNLEAISSRSAEMLRSGLGTLERDLKATLSDVATSLTGLNGSLQDAVQRLGRVQVDTSGLQTAMNDMTGVVAASNAGFQAHIRRLQELGNELRTTGEASQTAIRGAQTSIADAMGVLKQRADAAAVSIDHVATRLDAVQFQPEKMKAVFESLSDVVDASTQQVVSKLVGAAEASSNLSTTLQALSERVQGIDFRQMDTSMTSLVARIDGLAVALDRGTQRLSTDSLGTLANVLQQTSEQARLMNAVLDEIVAAVRLKLEQIQ